MFRNPVDIANRGLQHCGSPRLIDETEGFNEVSVQATNCAFVYDKLRKAELRRNLWRFSIRHAILRPIDSTFRLLAPALWSSTATYFMGSLVSDALGNIWISQVNDNLNFDPGNTDAWELYFGALAIPVWSATNTEGYYSGDVVYTTDGDGFAQVFMSLEAGNAEDPATTEAFDATVSYGMAALVVSSAVTYQSLVDFNLANTPSATTAPAAWAVGTTYAITNRVRGSDGYMYTSVGNGNVGNDPVSDGGINWTNTGVLAKWTSVLTRTASSSKWLRLDNAVLKPLFLVYPIGTGPITDRSSRNLYRLPANYLRKAPQDPSAGYVSPLGAPTNLGATDWVIEGQYIVTQQVQAIQFRFGADMVDVRQFDDLFCEGLGCRIGYEVAAAVTQSTDKRREIASAYTKFMGEARTVNGIETGPEAPTLDDWIAARV